MNSSWMGYWKPWTSARILKTKELCKKMLWEGQFFNETTTKWKKKKKEEKTHTQPSRIQFLFDTDFDSDFDCKCL